MIKRNEIYYVNFGENTKGCEQAGVRPAIILQNDKGNKYSPTTIVAPLTTKQKSLYLPLHIEIKKDNVNNLSENSIILLEQLFTIDKSRIIDKIGKIEDKETIEKINKSLKISLGMFKNIKRKEEKVWEEI